MEVVKQTPAAREDLGVLAVLEAVAGDARLSQRELARRTGLNLKKVNYCLRRLLESGQVTFQLWRRPIRSGARDGMSRPVSPRIRRLRRP